MSHSVISPNPLLAEPGNIGPMKLRNRVIMGPMGTNYGTTDGFSTERDKFYYGERARGGVAMIITEAMNISAGARNHNNSLCIFHDRFIPGLAAIVDEIKENGAYAVAQLNHRGQLLRRSVLGMQPVGPMSGKHPFTGEPVKALDRDGIREIQRDFVESAIRVQRAGYDGCEIHAANGYLFQQFFSQRLNQRDDEYGGSLENRMRLLLETVEMIADASPDMPLLVRISVSEFAEGGYTQEEALTLALALQKVGVAAIDLSGGSNEHPSLSRYCIQPPSFPRRCLETHSIPFREALDVPVIMAGRIIEPEDAEAALAAGAADFISVGRGLIADPHWAAKALGQVKAPVRRCISCNVCFERLTQERDVCCVANPLVGTEFESLRNLEPQLFEPLDPKNSPQVLVIGAGVAGLEAARMARGLGCRVEVWERALKPGGQLDLALASPDKEDVDGIWAYRQATLDDPEIIFRYGCHASEDAIRKLDPDVVMLATGAKPRSIPNQIEFGVPTFQAWDILRNVDLLKGMRHVTIIGGGMVGIETADFLNQRGIASTVIELRDALAPEMARNNRYEILQRLEKAGVQIITGASVVGVSDGEIQIETDDKAVTAPLGEAVITAIGSLPEREALAAVEATSIRHVLVGDCNSPGDFMTAVRDAAMVALSIAQEALQATNRKKVTT